MIEKGSDWGVAGRLDPGSPIFDHDHELARFLEDNTASSAGLRSGDMARTLGLNAGHDPAQSRFLVPVDAIRVRLDDTAPRMALAHVIAGRLVANRSVTAIMNAAFVRRLNIAPRAHPGDGQLDIVSLDLGLTDRAKALRRMRTATHVPHPGITTQRKAEGVLEFDRPRSVRIDGQRAGRAARLEFSVVPAAINVAV